MGGHAIRRGVDGVITIWMVTLLIFLLLRVTGNPIEILVPPDTLPEDRQRLMSFYGLDKPVWQQYLNFVKGVFVGNFGVSLRWADQGAFDVVMQRLPATVQLSGTAFIFSVVLGVGIGVLAATRPDTMVDRLGQVLAVAVGILSVFVAGVVGTLIAVLSGFLKGWMDRVLMSITDGFLALPYLMVAVTAVAILGPSLTNVIVIIGLSRWMLYARVLRGEVLKTVETDFVRLAVVAGCSRWHIILHGRPPGCGTPGGAPATHLESRATAGDGATQDGAYRCRGGPPQAVST